MRHFCVGRALQATHVSASIQLSNSTHRCCYTRRLLFLLLLWVTVSVADDCFFLGDCAALSWSEPKCWNCTSERLPDGDSSIIFQSLNNVSANLESLVVKEVIIRNSYLTVIGSNISSVRLSVENSFFRLINTTVVVQNSLSVDPNSIGSTLSLHDSVISSNTTILRSTHLILTGTNNTFNSTFTHLYDNGRLDIQSDLIWNGQLEISASNVTTNKTVSVVSTQLAATSWTLRNSTLRDATLTFHLPLDLINVTSDLSEGDNLHGLSFHRFTSITNSTLQPIDRCLRCDVLHSTLENLPNNSTLHLNGFIRLIPTFKNVFNPYTCEVSDSIIEGSSDLIIETYGSIFMNRVTLNTSGVKTISWSAVYFYIEDTVIDSAWTFRELEHGLVQHYMVRVRGASLLHLEGNWTLVHVRAKDITVDEINPGQHLFAGDVEIIDVDRLIIQRLRVDSDSRYLSLSNTTTYTIHEIYLEREYMSTVTPVRGGIPNMISDQLESNSECSELVRNSSISVDYNTTALYVTYLPPTPEITYGWTDGRYVYLRPSTTDFDQCYDDYLYHHDLVVDDDGQLRNSSSYRFDALPDENGCSHKRVTVYLKNKYTGIITSKGRQVDILPGNVVQNEYYPWGNYNETNFWMGALSGGDGKIRVTWNASVVPRPCGYQAEIFTFGNESVSVWEETFTLRADTVHYSECSISVPTVPTLSILYSKEGEYLRRSPYVPYAYPFFKSLLPVDLRITPDDVSLSINRATSHGNVTLWEVKGTSNVNCTCGTYRTIVQLHDTNGTLLVSHVSGYDELMVPYGRYVMYATSACVLPSDYSVGGYGRTLRREVELREEEKPFDSTKWIVFGSLGGALLLFMTFTVAIMIWMKRQQKGNYVQIQ
ncbi:hypothetical protein PROFUN_07135 [Planoprotostelium fungivorum]|uniref:Uncharacterized protein n=1 Tax=Planoprotostelium fungivorum TaxID=1890364 RepID=A0A2P6NMS0_9EUKA|nr:hypothetical protein PROFUN_07135 [Planoprotostelium fungivorum]